jgi:glycosyltransferase involved in cell wall biosynthesis
MCKVKEKTRRFQPGKEFLMQVIFVNYSDFRSQSGMHIFHLANALAKLGVSTAVCSHGSAATVTRYGKPDFLSLDMSMSPGHAAGVLNFKPGETLIHCWTPRESSRLYTEALAGELRAPVVVHMEDNEEAITGEALKQLEPGGCAPDTKNFRELWRPGQRLFYFSHPRRSREFLAKARGYTCIIETLLDFKPERVPGFVFWPSCEPEVFDLPAESSPEDKLRWGLHPRSVALFYPGNVHLLNIEEVTHLYGAVALLRKMGLPAQIIRFGNYPPDMREFIFDRFGISDAIVDLTDKITPAEIPQVIRAADFLVQPGEDNPFNHYRFPCKLPLFLASARPVILPPSNLGKHLRDGENCLILRSKQAEVIAACIKTLLGNPAKARAIGLAGRDFARRHFSWDKSAAALKRFYAKVLTGHADSG